MMGPKTSTTNQPLVTANPIDYSFFLYHYV